MHLKASFLSLLFLLCASSLGAQQPMQFSQYMFNKYQMNPAYAGFDFSLNVTGIYRSQWNEFANSPVSQNINAHLPMYLLNGAVGINVANEQIGYFNNTLSTISYNYVYETRIGLFSGGIKGGFIQSALNGSALRSPDGIYEGRTFSHNDLTLSEISQTGIGVLYGAGVYFIGNYFETGVSLSQLPSQSVSYNPTKVEFIPYMNFYFESEIDINDFLSISPSLLIKTDFIETQIDVSSVAKFNGNIFGGIGLRGYNSKSIDAAVLIAGWKFNEHYTLSYAYDIGLSALRSSHEGTHEILLSYNLNKLIGAGLPPKIIYNPRFL